MDLGLEKKKAFVSGSTGGIGFAIAQSLANEGASVFINGRSQERVDAAISKIKSSNKKAEVQGIVADVAKREGTSKVLASLDSVDILINNFGIYEVKPFEDISDEDWLRLFEANVLSGIRLSRGFLPKMKAQEFGRVVFISSESGINTPSEMIHYGLTKTSQLALSRGLAETTVGTKITVNSVLPGPTRSEGVEKYIADVAYSRGVDFKTVEDDFFKEVRPSSLIKRFATSEEVADLVTFVCSSKASAINGAALRVDGGVVRSIL
jgi:NAD(P)-dependent dehydrogenase (short-subunit alcohol dehydrogenase family)